MKVIKSERMETEEFKTEKKLISTYVDEEVYRLIKHKAGRTGSMSRTVYGILREWYENETQ